MNCDFLGASFVIRIGIEETVQEAGTATWRGHITHVPSGERRYVEDLAKIPAFIAPYLEKMRLLHWDDTVEVRLDCCMYKLDFSYEQQMMGRFSS